MSLVNYDIETERNSAVYLSVSLLDKAFQCRTVLTKSEYLGGFLEENTGRTGDDVALLVAFKAVNRQILWKW